MCGVCGLLAGGYLFVSVGRDVSDVLAGSAGPFLSGAVFWKLCVRRGDVSVQGPVCAGVFAGLFSYYATFLVMGAYSSVEFWLFGNGEPLFVAALWAGLVLTILVLAKGGLVAIPVAILLALLVRRQTIPQARIVDASDVPNSNRQQNQSRDVAPKEIER